MASQLSTSACARLHTAFRPATHTAYTRMFSDFSAFLVVAGLCLTQVSTLQVLAFMEFLYLNHFSPSNIANHLAGIKAMFMVYNLDHTAFLDNRIQLYLKSLKINRPFQPHIPQIVDEYLLARIVSVMVTGKCGSNYQLSLSCNRKSKKLNLTNLFDSQQ